MECKVLILELIAYEASKAGQRDVPSLGQKIHPRCQFQKRLLTEETKLEYQTPR